MTRPYVAFARKHHPQGWDHCFWLTCATRGHGGTHALVKCGQCRSNYTDEELT